MVWERKMPIKLAPLLQRRGNAAYAVGRFIEKSNDDATMTKTDPQILNRLERLFSIMEGRGRNNAAGCISRLILKHRDNVPGAEGLSCADKEWDAGLGRRPRRTR